MDYFQHPTAEVSQKAQIGRNTKIWHYVQVREGARIGENCILGKGVYIDFDVAIGDNVRIQNYCSIYHRSIIEDGVFVGPYACFTNDKNPRSINSKGILKNSSEWTAGTILVKKGASIGAASVLLPDISIGEYAMVGAGSVVTKDIPPYALFYGNPASFRGYICRCGKKIKDNIVCKDCGTGLDSSGKIFFS